MGGRREREKVERRKKRWGGKREEGMGRGRGRWKGKEREVRYKEKEQGNERF